MPLTHTGHASGLEGLRHLVDGVEGQLGRRHRGRACSRHSVWHTSSVWSSSRPRRSKLEPGGLVLLALPADADAEVEAAAGEHVEGGGRLGEHDRPAQGGDEDVGPQPDVGGRAGQHRERGHRFEPVAVGPGRLHAPGPCPRPRVGRTPRGARRTPRGPTPAAGPRPLRSSRWARSNSGSQPPGSSAANERRPTESWAAVTRAPRRRCRPTVGGRPVAAAARAG